MVRQAHETVFLTTLYLFNAQEACAMAMVGADIIVAHMGLTTASALGAKMAASLEDSVRHVLVIMDAVASEVDPDVIVLCHGGLSL
jgi:predicted TIM-barrel enzyme